MDDELKKEWNEWVMAGLDPRKIDYEILILSALINVIAEKLNISEDEMDELMKDKMIEILKNARQEAMQTQFIFVELRDWFNEN